MGFRCFDRVVIFFQEISRVFAVQDIVDFLIVIVAQAVITGRRAGAFRRDFYRLFDDPAEDRAVTRRDPWALYTPPVTS